MKTKEEIQMWLKPHILSKEEAKNIAKFLIDEEVFDNELNIDILRRVRKSQYAQGQYDSFLNFYGNKRTLEKEPTKVGSIEVGVDVKTCDECEYKKKAEKEVLRICFDNGKKPSIFSEKLNIGSKKWWEEKDDEPKAKENSGLSTPFCTTTSLSSKDWMYKYFREDWQKGNTIIGFRRGCGKSMAATLFASVPQFIKGNSYKYRNEERRELKEQLEAFKKLRDSKKSGQVYRLACEDIARIEKMLEERV